MGSTLLYDESNGAQTREPPGMKHYLFRDPEVARMAAVAAQVEAQMLFASTAAEQAALNGIAAVALYLGINTGTPGTTTAAALANELTGGAPAYARLGITWGVASAANPSAIANMNAMVFNVPASTITNFSTWTIATLASGTYEVGGALSASQVFSSQGTFTIAAAGLTVQAS